MFYSLLLVTFLLALAVSFVVVRLFRGSIQKILDRIVADELSTAWARYISFAVYVVGVSGGVRLFQLERYLSSASGEDRLVLDSERWVMEVYSTIISTLQSVAWMLLLFFIFALIAYVLVRSSEMKHGNRKDTDDD